MTEIKVHRPSEEAELQIALGLGNNHTLAGQFFTAEELLKMQDLISRMPVSEGVSKAVVRLVRSTIPNGIVQDKDYENARSSDPELQARASLPAMMKAYVHKPEDAGDGGAGIRASMALMQCIRARAFMQGRLTPNLEDVIEMAEPVLRHRLTLSPLARPNLITTKKLIDAALAPLLQGSAVKAASPVDTPATLAQAATQVFSGTEAAPPASVAAHTPSPSYKKWIGGRLRSIL